MRARTVLLAVWAAASMGLSAAAEVVEVRIENYKFIPPELTVKAGTTVRWINAEKRTSHSILWLGAQPAESDRPFPGDTYERRFDKPGTYAYTCGPHPEMKGVVVVTDR